MDTQEIQKDKAQEKIKDTILVLSNSSNKNDIKSRILLRTEKLSSAIYLITGLMDSRENIKWDIRSISSQAVSDLYLFGGLSSKFFNTIEHITSLLRVGFNGGLISEMNFSILVNEYQKIKDALIRLGISRDAESMVLSAQTFGPDVELIESKSQEQLRLKDNDGQIKDIKSLSYTKRKEGVPYKNIHKIPRHEIIIKLMKSGVEYGIKDIVSQMSAVEPKIDCSEKTVQRDILSLVAGGILLKKGERRWSRYILAHISQQ